MDALIEIGIVLIVYWLVLFTLLATGYGIWQLLKKWRKHE